MYLCFFLLYCIISGYYRKKITVTVEFGPPGGGISTMKVGHSRLFFRLFSIEIIPVISVKDRSVSTKIYGKSDGKLTLGKEKLGEVD